MIDEETINEARNGDDEAMLLVLNRCKDILFASLMRMTGNRAQTEDILQSTYLQIIKSIKKFKGKSSFNTWAYRIAVNEFLKTERNKKAGKIITDLPDTTRKIKDTDNDTQSNVSLNILISTLTPQERTVMSLRYYDNYKIAEIAEIMVLSESSVKTYIKRSLSKLEKILDKERMK